LRAARQPLRAAQAVGDDPAIDIAARRVDAVGEQTGVGGGEGLIGQSLPAVHDRQADVPLPVVVVGRLVDAAVARCVQESGERSAPLRYAEETEDAIRSDAG